jgi:hypothetical protein
MTKDEELMLAEDLDFTGGTDEYDTDTITNIKWLNDNADVRVLAYVKTTYTTGNTLTLKVKLYDGSSWITFHTTAAHAAADLVAGFKALDYTLPKDLEDYTQLKVSLTEGDSNFDAGQMDVFVTL